MSWILSVWMMTSLAAAEPALGDGKPGAASPEALVAELVQFNTWGEFDDMLSCMAPAYRVEVKSLMIGIVLLTYSMKHMDEATQEVEPKAAERMNKALKKHKLSLDMGPEEMDRGLAKVDASKLIEDVAELVFGKKLPADTTFPQAYRGEIEGLKIDGDRAQAKVDDEDTYFVRQDGAWYLDATPLPQ